MMFYYQLRNELWKLFGKKRTYIGFGICLLAESIILLLFRYTQAPRRGMIHRLEMMGYDPNQFITNLTMATQVLIPVAYVLLPLYVSLVGGDLVAKEAEDGTLRMILSRPISRLRLVGIKWLAGAFFSVLLSLALAAFGVALASLLFPAGGMFAMVPNGIGLFDASEGWRRYAIATLALSTKAITITGLGWMFSCFNIKPAAATILALSVILTSRIIQEIPFFHDWQPYFISYHVDSWLDSFQQPLPAWKMIQSLSVLFGYNFTFFVVGASIFHTRDIKS